MKPDRTDLSSALQSGEPGERTSFCPDDATIGACYDDRLERAEQDRVAHHLANCAYCRARLGMLARLAESGGAQSVPEDVLARAKQIPAGARVRRRRWPAAVAAAVAMLAIGLVLTLGSPSNPGATGDGGSMQREAPLPQLRSVEASALRPRILNPTEGSELEPGAFEFRWTPVDGAVRYELLLMDESGGPLFTEDLENTVFRPARPQELEQGARYYLRVTAHLADGRTAGSRHVSFSIAAADGDRD